MIPIAAALKIVGAAKLLYDIYEELIEDPTEGKLEPLEHVNMVKARQQMIQLRDMLNEADLEEDGSGEDVPAEEKSVDELLEEETK